MICSLRGAAVLLLALLPVLATAELTVTSIKRQVSVEASIVTYTDTLEVKNAGSSVEKELLYCGYTKMMANAALVEVLQGKDDLAEAKTAPAATPATAPAGVSCLAVTLDPPLKKGAATTVKVMGQYINALAPFPETVSQKDAQLVVLEDNMLPLMPYKADAAEVKVTLTSSTVPSYTKLEPVSKTDKTLKYGPYGAQPAWAVQPLRVHFENNQPFVEVTTLEREFEVSHWGNVYVEEKFEVRHGGAKLKGPWSRLDYQSNPAIFGRSAIKQLQLSLPGGVRSMYYRDEIGNISTSTVRTTRQKVDVTLEPRFPLFGGWKTKAVLGYSLPLGKVVSTLRGGQLRFHTKFGCPIKGAVTDQLVIKVVLPEGAKNIKVDAPFDSVTVGSETKFTYLDTSGRPVVVVSMRNVVPTHSSSSLSITYSFATIGMLREPALLIAAFAVLFATAIALSRLELTMSKDSKWVAGREAERVVDAVQRLERVMMGRRALLRDMDSAIASKPVDECTALKGQAEASFKNSAEQVKLLVSEIETASPRVADRFRVLSDRERDVVTGSLALYSKKLELLKSGARAAEIEKKVGATEKAVLDASVDFKAAADKLFAEY